MKLTLNVINIKKQFNISCTHTVLVGKAQLGKIWDFLKALGSIPCECTLFEIK
jgi:hypothetical protein